MADLGKIVVTDGGTYSAAVTYEKLTFVHYNDDAYLTLKTVKGVTPTDDGVNYRLFCKSAVTATTSKAGIVMPDGTTIGISNGKITAKTATQTTVGVTKGSNDIIVGKDGGLSLNTKFEQATALANIVAGEALKVVLGKVSKAIATTMNLDENALLKNMISGIDVNNGEKVPSSAFVHTLYERLGMGTDLSAGDAENVTQAVNALYSDLTLKANGYIVMSNLDLNSIEFGIYLVTNAVNAPDANWWMILSAVNNGTGSQIAKSVTSKTIMARELIAGNWNSWYSLHA
ncbi:MAG: pyocin knob domain-containing protein [Roseburia sp.]